LARSGVIFAVATGLSRVVGLVREIVQAAVFGISGPVNAFEIAFLIPNTVRALVADSALSGAFVPVFSDLLVKGERRRAWRVASSTRLYWYATAILVATIVQFLLPLPWLRGRDDHLRMVIDIHDPAVKRVFTLMIPVTIGLGLININAAIDQLFATHFLNPHLAPAAIVRAFRLYMLPQGM